MASSDVGSGMRSEAAVVVQSHYRGYRVRKEYKRIREEQEADEGEENDKQEENLNLEFVERRQTDLDGAEATTRNDSVSSVGRHEVQQKVEIIENERNADTRGETSRETDTDPDFSRVRSERAEEEKVDELGIASHTLQTEELLQDEVADTQHKEVKTRETEDTKDRGQSKSKIKVVERSKAEKQEGGQEEAERQTSDKSKAERVEAEKHKVGRRDAEKQKLERVKMKKQVAETHKTERRKAEKIKSEKRRLEAENHEDEKQEAERHEAIQKQKGEDKRRTEMAEAAATTIQKNYRGYLARKDYPKLQAGNQKEALPPRVQPPMLSQQIVDEVTRAMEMIMHHSEGTLTKQQIERANALQVTPVGELQRWTQPKQREEEVKRKKEGQTQQKHTDGYAKAISKMPRRPDGIPSLKAPSLRPLPLKKTTNYLRTYLRAVGRPEKASADIRLRFKSNPRQQPPELTNIWDIKKRHENGKFAKGGKHGYGYETSLAGNVISPLESHHVTAYRHSMPPQPWQASHQGWPYDDRVSSGLYSEAVMSDWTATSSLPSLEHMQSYSADSDYSAVTGSSSLHATPPFNQNLSLSEMYSAVRGSTDNRWVTGRVDRLARNVVGRHRLEPLQRTTDRWAARPMQSKQSSSVGYAARHKTLADVQR